MSKVKFWLIGNRRGVPPYVGRIGNPPYTEHQIYWSTTANPREPKSLPCRDMWMLR